MKIKNNKIKKCMYVKVDIKKNMLQFTIKNMLQFTRKTDVHKMVKYTGENRCNKFEIGQAIKKEERVYIMFVSGEKNKVKFRKETRRG